jgi:hypothetical protein
MMLYFLLIPSEFCDEGVAQPPALDRQDSSQSTAQI